MKTTHSSHCLLSLVVLCTLAGAAHGALVLNTDQTFISNPPVGDEYHFTNPAGNTWTVNGSITVGNGSTADSRVFVGIGVDSGKLTLNGADGIGDSLLINGYHPAAPALGRIGHSTALGTLNIGGGLAVTLGGRKMHYAGNGGTNTINIVDGILSYTTAGFGWEESDSGGFVDHVIGADGSLIVPGVMTDAAGFATWAVSSGTGVELNDIFVTADSGLTLSFTDNGSFTTITAIPEPNVAVLIGGFGVLGLLRRRRN